MNFILFLFNVRFILDVGHDTATEGEHDHVEGPEGVQDDSDLLRHVLQPGEVPRPRAARPLRHPEGDGRGRQRGKRRRKNSRTNSHRTFDHQKCLKCKSNHKNGEIFK